MASTVEDIIQRFQTMYRDCDDAYALTLFRDAHSELMQRCQLRNSTEAISQVSGTREYDLPVGVWMIHEAYLEGSSDRGDWRVLRARSTDELSVKSVGWRAMTPGSPPMEYYISTATDSNSAKNVIGFNPIPDETSDAVTGYPLVRLYVTSLTALDISDTVPSNLLNDKVYTYMMAEGYSAERHDDQTGKWRTLANEQIDANVRHVKDLQSQTNMELVPTTFFTSRVR